MSVIINKLTVFLSSRLWPPVTCSFIDGIGSLTTSDRLSVGVVFDVRNGSFRSESLGGENNDKGFFDTFGMTGCLESLFGDSVLIVTCSRLTDTESCLTVSFFMDIFCHCSCLGGCSLLTELFFSKLLGNVGLTSTTGESSTISPGSKVSS